jgi:hypothetical protein
VQEESGNPGWIRYESGVAHPMAIGIDKMSINAVYGDPYYSGCTIFLTIPLWRDIIPRGQCSAFG